MKYKFIILFVMLLLIQKSFSQPPAPGSNTPRPELDKFVGTWKWTNGAGTEVTIMLKKANLYFPIGDYYEDELVGCHEYIVNGNIQENYLPNFPNVSQDNLGSIFLGYYDGTDPNVITGNLRDHSKHKLDNIELDFVLGSPATLTWKLRDIGDFIVPPTLPGVTLPTDLVLIKQ